MAVPATVTMPDMTGKYSMNKNLSDSSQAMLKQQGVGWVIRQAAQYSAVDLQMKHFQDDKGVWHYDQIQVSTGGITNSENRVLDWEWREADNNIWGKVKGRTRLAKIEDLEDDFLKEGWAEDTVEFGVIESQNESVSNGWTATQVIGFADDKGERKHVRRAISKKGKQVETIRIVYDWKP